MTASTLRVLVIEDDADTRANLRDILELDDCQVAAAGTLAEAFSRHDWSELSLIVLDRKLPDGTAEAALPRLRRLAPDAAVMIVTGYADLDGAISALRHGAADYILKPINADALRASVAAIVERRRIRQALGESQEALRRERDFAETLIATAQAIVLVLDLEGHIVRFNPYMEQISGYPLPEVVGRDWFSTFLPANDQARLREVFSRVLAGQVAVGILNPIVTKDGRLREIKWSNKALKDAQGNTTGVLAVGHDMSELNEAQRKALQAERLAAIGQMIAGLTHESRNALQRSKACLEMLALEVQDRPAALDLVGRIDKAQSHLQRLYEEVRTYAAPINLNREPCDLAAVWRETWSLVAPLGQDKALGFREELPAEHFPSLVDRFAIGQVFRNIFENAIAVSPQSGLITVRAQPAHLEGQLAWAVTVGDHGPGLSAEQRERIFEPFFTTKTKGTGLGMAIARRIAQSHGGQLEVGNGPGPGAEIIVTLPQGAA
jgi:hypothetical protein